MGVLLVLIGYFLGLYFFDNATAGLAIAILVWVVLSLVAYFQGDSILLGMSRAKKINRDDHPRLYNVVEEMKIASGLEKMPDIYIIDDPALNAFATGRDPNKASVAITSGLLQRLSRDELQGVIGHEISHIKNRDVLLMAMCGVLLGTIVYWPGTGHVSDFRRRGVKKEFLIRRGRARPDNNPDRGTGVHDIGADLRAAHLLRHLP